MKLSCGGFITDGKLHIQGDHKDAIRTFLITEKIAKASNIALHGI
jgi:translation initiation factor 1 (eIF-1/SUI1)